MKKAKVQYDYLIESGDLLEMFPDYTGNWNKDKKDFLKHYESNMKDLNMMDVEFDEF